MLSTSGNRLGDLGEPKQCQRLASPISHYCLTIASFKNATVKEIGIPSGLCIPRECTGEHIDELINGFLSEAGEDGVLTSTRCGDSEPADAIGFTALSVLWIALLIGTQVVTLFELCLIGDELYDDPPASLKQGPIAKHDRTPPRHAMIPLVSPVSEERDHLGRPAPRHTSNLSFALDWLGVRRPWIRTSIVVLLSAFSLRASLHHLTRKAGESDPHLDYLKRGSQQEQSPASTSNCSSPQRAKAKSHTIFPGLDGMRTGSMVWIIVGHVYVYSVFPGLDDIWNLLPPDGHLSSWKYQVAGSSTTKKN